MINRFLKRSFMKTVNDYGKKLASDSVTDPKEAEKCHLAKLTLIPESQNDLRTVSLKTLADLGSEVVVPHVLREIALLTKTQPNERACKIISDLFLILCSRKPGLARVEQTQ